MYRTPSGRQLAAPPSDVPAALGSPRGGQSEVPAARQWGEGGEGGGGGAGEGPGERQGKELSGKDRRLSQIMGDHSAESPRFDLALPHLRWPPFAS